MSWNSILNRPMKKEPCRYENCKGYYIREYYQVICSDCGELKK